MRLIKEIELDTVYIAWLYLYRHRKTTFGEYVELLIKNNYKII